MSDAQARPDWFAPVETAGVDLEPLRWCPSACSDAMLFCTVLADALVDRWCWRTALELGLEPGGPLPSGPDRPDGVAEDRAPIWRYVARRLLQRGLAATDSGGVPRLRSAEPAPTRLDAAVDEARGREDAAAIVELIDLAGQAYPAVLRGEKDGEDVLVSPASLGIWGRYFSNRNAQYAAVNDMTATVVSERAGAEAPVDVLEVGGGFGSAAEAILTRLGDRVGAYRFTERVPFFLSKARTGLGRSFGDAVPGLSFAAVDLEQPLADQGVPEACADVAAAVNVVHAVPDLGAALANLTGALRPGGHLVLGEAIRLRRDHALAVEFPFQLTRPFREFVEEPWRPEGGFLHHADMVAALRSVPGLEDVQLRPAPETVAHLEPPFCLGVFSARKA